jgi:hypothetical protein
VHFDRYAYGLLMKKYLLDLYILLNIPSKWCFIIQATFVTSEFLHYGFFRKFRVQIKLFKFDKLWEIFDKSSEHYEKMPYFSFKICCQYTTYSNVLTTNVLTVSQTSCQKFQFDTILPHVLTLFDFDKKYFWEKLIFNWSGFIIEIRYICIRNVR